MTTTQSPPEQQSKPKRRRIGLWLVLALQVVFLIWIIAGAASGHNTPVDCTGLSAQDCKTAHDAADTGTALGVTMIAVLWFVTDAVIGFIGLVVWLARRGPRKAVHARKN